MTLTPLEREKLSAEAEGLRHEFWSVHGTGPESDERKRSLRGRYKQIQEILRRDEIAPIRSAPETPKPEPPREETLRQEPTPREHFEVEQPARRSRWASKAYAAIGILSVALVLGFPLLPYILTRDAGKEERTERTAARATTDSLLGIGASSPTLESTGDLQVTPSAASVEPPVSWNTRDPDIRTNGNVELAANLLERRTHETVSVDWPPSLGVQEFVRDPLEHFGQTLQIEGKVNSVSEHTKEVLTRKGQRLSFWELHLDATESRVPFAVYVPSESEVPVKGASIVVEGLPVGYLALHNSSDGKVMYPALVGSLRQVLGKPGQSSINHLGDVVVLASLEIVVTDVREEQYLDASFMNHEPKHAQSGKKFVIIGLTVLNRTESEFVFSPDFGARYGSGCRLRLLDGQGIEYLTYGESIWFLQKYLNYRNLRPKVPESGFLTYEIPADARGYRLMLDEDYTVVLAEP